MRLAEIDLALSKIRSFAWSDQAALVLMGHSEGGWVVSQYPKSDVDRVIWTGWNCNARPTTAVASLGIIATDDKWNDSGSCGGAAVVTVDGSAHNVYAYNEAKDAVSSFLYPLQR